MNSSYRSRDGKFLKGHGKIRNNESYKKTGEKLKKVIHTSEWNKKVAIKRKQYLDKNPMPRGEKHWSWKGGISRGYKEGYWSKEYLQWRKLVFERDGYKCQVCRKGGGYLTAHHIKSWAHYPKLRFDIDNGITLCENCHSLTDNYKGRGKNHKLLLSNNH